MKPPVTLIASPNSKESFREQMSRHFGQDVRIADDEEAEKATVVVCILKGSPTPFTDNLVGRCVGCAREVIFRPHAPKKPPRICSECLPDIEKHIGAPT